MGDVFDHPTDAYDCSHKRPTDVHSGVHFSSRADRPWNTSSQPAQARSALNDSCWNVYYCSQAWLRSDELRSADERQFWRGWRASLTWTPFMPRQQGQRGPETGRRGGGGGVLNPHTGRARWPKAWKSREVLDCGPTRTGFRVHGELRALTFPEVRSILPWSSCTV